MQKNNVFVGIFFRSEKVLANIMVRLNELEDKLIDLYFVNNKVSALVMLFDLISPLQDEYFLANEIASLQKHAGKKRKREINALKTIAVHIEQCGRSEFGMNRSQKGSIVTAHDVYLGNVFGLFTNTAAYFLSRQKDMELELRPDASKSQDDIISNWYLISQYQCASFLKSHIDGMMKQIHLLKALS